MNEISCEMCLDLIPLVKDGIACEDSKQAVESHVQSCDVCRELYNKKDIPEVSADKAFKGIQKQLRTFFIMLLMFGIVFGLSFRFDEFDYLYNILIMPIVGALGYVVFKLKALYAVPAVLFLTHFVINLFNHGDEALDLYSVLIWTAIYAVLALLGVIVSALLHFAFRKESK